MSVLEAANGPAQGASGKSWAWLNANRKEPEAYKDLSVQSMQEWRQLPGLAEFPGVLLGFRVRLRVEGLPMGRPVMLQGCGGRVGVLPGRDDRHSSAGEGCKPNRLLLLEWGPLVFG